MMEMAMSNKVKNILVATFVIAFHCYSPGSLVDTGGHAATNQTLLGDIDMGVGTLGDLVSYIGSSGQTFPSDLTPATNYANTVAVKATNYTDSVAQRKQDRLPYQTNAIPYSAISGTPDISKKQDTLPYPTNAIPYSALSGAPDMSAYATNVEVDKKQDRLPYQTNAIPYSAITGTPNLNTKQDKLPYATNAIPYSAISGTPSLSGYATHTEVSNAATSNTNYTDKISSVKQDKLPYPTNSIPYSAISGVPPSQAIDLTPATNYASEVAVKATNYTDSVASRKQNALTAAQTNAINSGVTSGKVSTWDGYAQTINGKQDKLPYPTNAIPYSVISGVPPSQAIDLTPATNYANSVAMSATNYADSVTNAIMTSNGDATSPPFYWDQSDGFWYFNGMADYAQDAISSGYATELAGDIPDGGTGIVFYNGRWTVYIVRSSETTEPLAYLSEVTNGIKSVAHSLTNYANSLAYKSTNYTDSVALRKQDKLPYPTNAIPASAIVGGGQGGSDLTPATNYTDSAISSATNALTIGLRSKTDMSVYTQEMVGYSDWEFRYVPDGVTVLGIVRGNTGGAVFWTLSYKVNGSDKTVRSDPEPLETQEVQAWFTFSEGEILARRDVIYGVVSTGDRIATTNYVDTVTSKKQDKLPYPTNAIPYSVITGMPPSQSVDLTPATNYASEVAVKATNYTDSVASRKQNALTAAQTNAINSGVTSSKVSTWDGYAQAINGKQDKLPYQTNAIPYAVISGTPDMSTYATKVSLASTSYESTNYASSVAMSATNYTDSVSSGKQNSLTAAQTNAINSGVTSSKVSTWDGYAQTINGKQDKLPYSTNAIPYAVISGAPSGSADLTPATNYTDFAVSTNNPAFVNAVTNCPINLSSIGGSSIGEFGGYGTVGALLAAIVAAIVLLRTNKADWNKLTIATPTVTNNSFELDQNTSVYRVTASISNGVTTIPVPSATAIPNSSAYFCFEMEVSVGSGATSLVGPSGWTWVDGGELPTSDFAEKILYISVRLDCNQSSREYIANVWRIADIPVTGYHVACTLSDAPAPTVTLYYSDGTDEMILGRDVAGISRDNVVRIVGDTNSPMFSFSTTQSSEMTIPSDSEWDVVLTANVVFSISIS